MDTSSVHRYLRYPCDKHSCRSLVTLKFESQANREEVFWSPTQSGKVYIRPLLSCYQLPRCFRLMLVAAVTVSQTHKVKGQLFLTSDARRWVDTVLFSQSFSPYQLNPGFIARFRSSSDFFFPPFLFLPDDAQYPFFFPPRRQYVPQADGCSLNRTRFPQGQAVTSLFTYMNNPHLSLFPTVQTAAFVCRRTHPEQWYFLCCALHDQRL